jgi:hypothetical protein
MSWPADSSSAHRALRYRDEPEFRACVGSFIQEGLDRGERVLAAVPAGQLAWIRAELGGDPPGVEFADAAGFYRRQGRASREVATEGTGTHVRLLTRLPGPGGPEPVS